MNLVKIVLPVMLLLPLSCGKSVVDSSQLKTDFVRGACAVEEPGKFLTTGGGCLDMRTHLVWNAGIGNGKLSYKAALKFCSESRESGKADWRVPLVEELASIAGDLPVQDHFKFGRRAELVWAFNGEDVSSGWAVVMTSNDMFSADEMAEKSASVLCVREPADVDQDAIPDEADACSWPNKADFRGIGPVQSTNQENGCRTGEPAISAAEAQVFMCKKESGNFKTSAGGCRQARTNLVWSPIASSPRNFSAAESYCQEISNGPWRGWRLPSISELKGIAMPEMASEHLGSGSYSTVWASDLTQKIFEGRRNVYMSANDYRLETDRHGINLTSGEVDDVRWTSYTSKQWPTDPEPPTFQFGESETKSVICVK